VAILKKMPAEYGGNTVGIRIRIRIIGSGMVRCVQ
jgi:hypothetical protein